MFVLFRAAATEDTMTPAKPSSYHQLAGTYACVEHSPDGESHPNPTGRLVMVIEPDGVTGRFEMDYVDLDDSRQTQKASFTLDNWTMTTKIEEATRPEYVGVVAPVECRLDGRQLTFTWLDPGGVLGNLFQVWMRG